MHSRIASLFALLCLLAVAMPTAAQSGALIVEMEVEAAFDGYFRDEEWLPVRVTVTNNGDPIDGRILVRPETSRGVGGTYSVPIDLPTNSRKTDFLYLTARALTTNLRVELLENQDDLVLAQVEVPINAIQSTDQLYVIVTQSAAGSIDLSSARAPGMGAVQANWEVETIPNNPVAMRAVNMLVFTDVDTGGLSLRQEAALEAWIANGGHLIVTGGPNWQPTAAGFPDLLPLQPDDSTPVNDVSGLAAFIGQDASLSANTVMATGTLRSDAEVLIRSNDGLPLLVRRSLGEGTIDYLAVDPNTAPLRNWSGMSNLWYSLAATREPLPNWTQNFIRWDQANAAAEVLPGIEVLPSVLPICGFLALYIILIGPVNYIVLNRINRREYAWITIPVLIIAFSGLAAVVGGQLRGTDPSIGRLQIVRGWEDTDIAHTTEVIGLLSPNRTQYTLEVAEGTFLRAIPRNTLTTNTLLQSTFQTSINIEQFNGFRAADFPVDASFIAGFAAYGTSTKPDLSGTATIFYPNPDAANQTVRGSVRNDLDIPLEGAVVMARGTVHRFRDPIEPGDIETFDLLLEGNEAPPAAPIGYYGLQTSLGYGYNYNNNLTDRTVRDLLGENLSYNPMFPNNNDVDEVEEQEERRRQLFLNAVIADPYFSTGRGNDVYFAGWTQTPATELTLADRDFREFDSTLYIIRLDTEVETPTQPRVRVGSDQFVWSVYEKIGIGSSSPVNLNVSEGNAIAFRFTPIPDARLDQVDELIISIRHNSGSNRTIRTELWNWRLQQWDSALISNNQLVISSPTPVIGPQNAVVLRIIGAESGFMNIQSLHIEQIGSFDS